jgi:hypothetical protein
MTKYEPNFFVPCDNLRNVSISPVLCKDEPLAAATLAVNFLNEFLSREQKDVLVLNENKSQILPGKLQEKVKITAMSNGTLMLKTNSSVWRAETLCIKNNIIAACNKVLGKTAVKTVRVG